MIQNFLLKAILLLLCIVGGVNMHAQSIAAEQMDERFNNEDNKIPFGWFAKGWSVEKGLISSDSSSSFGGFGSSTPGGEGGTPEFDMSSLFGSNDTYWLLTPPVDVKQGEQLVFSAKKKKDDSGIGGGSGGSMDMGSFFVVERSVYGSNKWVKVQDLYDDLGDDLKEFTVTAEESGEFRYRFRTSTGVSIDSVAGFHIDNQAPDLYIVVEDTETSFVPYGVCTADSTKTFCVINTGTGAMDVTMTLSNSSYFKMSTNQVHVQPGDTARVDVTFVYSAGTVGWNASEITFTASDNRLSVQKIGVSAIISEPGCWVEDFNAQKQTPYGWFTEGWEWSDSTMTVKSGSNPMMGGGGYLMTPPLDVRDTRDPLVFAVKKGGGSGFDMSAMMDMFMGGSGSLLTVEKSVYGSNHWDKVHEFTDSIDKNYHTLAVTGFEAGKYRFRFKSSSTLSIDSVAGFRIDNNAPDLYVTVDSAAVDRYSFGMQKANSTKRFVVMNTGTGTLQVNMATKTGFFDVSPKSLTIAAGDSAFVDVSFVYDERFLGEKNDEVIFTPTDERIVAQSIALKAYATYTDAWEENFEPEVEYVGDDEKTFPVPEGWETDGWVLKKGSGGGIAGMMSTNNSWQANSTDNTYYLITPTLQANQGDMLYFQVNMGGGLASVIGGGATTPLTIHYDRNGDGNWQKFGDFTDSGAIIFVAPYSGKYRLKFTGKDVMLDNFMGFRTPLEEIAIYDGQDNSAVLQQYDGQTVNVNYDRVLSAVDNGDGTWKSKAYTICLPYEFDFNKYYEKDQVKLYRLVLVDDYYYEFVFTNDFPVASAGLGYLVVVNYGSVNLNAVNAKITASLKHEEMADYTAVYSYKDFKDKKTDFEPIGTWRGTYNAIENEEAAALAAYGVYNGGKMKIICSDTEAERNARLGTFRAFYEPKNHHAIDGKRSFDMKFIQTLAGDLDDAAIEDFPADAFADDETTGIDSPVFHIIEADGTHTYYDLQGRQLEGKPTHRGLYITDGKVVVIE